jgi:hypothetical protein
MSLLVYIGIPLLIGLSCFIFVLKKVFFEKNKSNKSLFERFKQSSLLVKVAWSFVVVPALLFWAAIPLLRDKLNQGLSSETIGNGCVDLVRENDIAKQGEEIVFALLIAWILIVFVIQIAILYKKSRDRTRKGLFISNLISLVIAYLPTIPILLIFQAMMSSRGFAIGIGVFLIIPFCALIGSSFPLVFSILSKKEEVLDNVKITIAQIILLAITTCLIAMLVLNQAKVVEMC